MSAPQWKNIYELSEDQFQRLEQAEEKMESMEINTAESILKSLLDEDLAALETDDNGGWTVELEHYEERAMPLPPLWPHIRGVATKRG